MDYQNSFANFCQEGPKMLHAKWKDSQELISCNTHQQAHIALHTPRPRSTHTPPIPLYTCSRVASSSMRHRRATSQHERGVVCCQVGSVFVSCVCVCVCVCVCLSFCYLACNQSDSHHAAAAAAALLHSSRFQVLSTQQRLSVTLEPHRLSWQLSNRWTTETNREQIIP